MKTQALKKKKRKNKNILNERMEIQNYECDKKLSRILSVHTYIQIELYAYTYVYRCSILGVDLAFSDIVFKNDILL